MIWRSAVVCPNLGVAAMLSFLLLLLAPPSPEPWRDLLARIEACAVSEPPVLSIDTRIRAAKALASKQPAEARRLLDEAISLTHTFTDRNTRAILFNDIYHALQPFDPAAAEDLTATLPLVAFTTPALAQHLRDTVKRHPESAAAEYSTLLAAFPADPSPEDVSQLLQFTRDLGSAYPDLAKEGFAKARAALKDRRFRTDPDTLRDLEAQAAGRPPADRQKRNEDPEAPSVEGLSDTEIVTLARRQSPIVALTLLLDLLDDAKPLPPLPRRLSIAREALDLSDKLPPGEDRLVVQSMLTRRLYHYGDPATAAKAARLLEDSFRKTYDCDNAACTSIRLQGNPGEPIADFAEYLLENNIRPAALNLTNASLDARVLILELGTLLNGKRKSLFAR